MVELIITEKPSSAQKVATALADTQPVKKKSKQSSYFEITHKGTKIFVTSAVGHLYTLQENEKSWNYPSFDIHWVASFETNKDLTYTKDYVQTIAMLAKKADTFTIACDYDVEGEVIGYNVLRFACKQKDAHRMKFSTLTKGDLIESYETKLPHIDWGQAYAGETRHKLDWFYGINVSRALTASVKAAGSFHIMSAGRVQGPALKMLVDREKEIQAFVPVPYWEVSLDGKYNTSMVEAHHTKGKIFEKPVVEQIIKNTKDQKTASITDVKRTQRKQAPPTPFNLTDLQSEAYALFKITPKHTLQIAQALYVQGITSYPRTSSQQLDPKLGFKKILTDLSKQAIYKPLTSKLLKFPQLKPNNGKKTDPAHPSIYPTGQVPKGLEGRDQKIYDLIVKRFMAAFASPALRETMTVSIDVNKEPFALKGTRTLEENWHEFYKPYLKVDDVILPDMKQGETIDIDKITKHDKETQPPKRFNQSSIIKELEKRNLGTKATRADILERLFQRGYIEGVKITVTQLGIETIDVLEKHATDIVNEQLTAEFEEGMEQIRQGKTTPDKILSKAQSHLIKLLKEFKGKEKEIGEDLIKSIKIERKVKSKERILGKDPKTGKQISVRIGKFGPLVQLGVKEGDQVPKYASLGQKNIDEITLLEALELFKLPRILGKTKEDEEISTNYGRFGPYVKFGSKYVSIKEKDPLTITLQEALVLIEEKKIADANKEIQVFENSVKVLNGPYGPYITNGKKNARMPKDVDPKKLTLKECEEILAKAPAKKKWSKKKTSKKKTTTKKKTTKKKIKK